MDKLQAMMKDFEADTQLIRKALKKSNDPGAVKALDRLIDGFQMVVKELLTKHEEMEQRINANELKIQQQEKKTEELSLLVNNLCGTIKEERKKRLSAETKALSTTIMVNGIPFNEKAIKERRTETNVETFAQVKTLIRSLKIDENKVTSVYRLPSKEVERKGSKIMTNTTKITFTDIGMNIDFFKSLVNYKDKDFPIRAQDALPVDLLKEKLDLEAIASRWRSQDNDLRTKVQARGGEMVLMTKRIGEDKYTQAGRSDITNELDWRSKAKKAQDEKVVLLANETKRQSQGRAEKKRQRTESFQKFEERINRTLRKEL